MKKLIVLALLSLNSLFAGQSLRLTSGDTASFTPPDSVPWTALGAFRGEIFAKINTCTSGEWFQLGAFVINCSSANTLRMFTGADQTLLDVTGRSEVIIRFQRDPDQTLASSNGANPLAHIEIWDADGTDYLAGSQTASADDLDVSSIQSLALSTIDIEIHAIKLYSTLIEKGQNAPLPDPHGVGDLATWEFEGNLDDDGPYGIKFSASGHAFSTTATMNPVADPAVDNDPFWMQQPSVRAGAEITLSADRSISHDDVDGLTCAWSDQGGGSGPTAILFTGSTTDCTTTAVFPTYGEYDLRLVVTDDSSNVGTTDITVGAVATDDNRIVVMDDDAFAFALGDNIQWGQSAWPFLPERMYKMAEQFIVNRAEPGWRTKGAGTVSVSNGSPTVTGSGTDFQYDYCSGGSTPDDSAKLVITDDDGINWPASIASCDSATQVTLTANWNKASDGGLAYSFWPATNVFFWANGSDNENYYDNVWAYYTLCKTSGFQWACEAARDLAELWWEMPYINEGRGGTGPNGAANTSPPRVQAMVGMMLWAKDQGTEAIIFPGIADIIEFYDSIWIIHPSNYCMGDPREAWYVGMWLSLARELDIDETRVAHYESILTAAMDASGGASGGDIDPNICRHPDGGWHGYNTNAGSSTVSVKNGSNTFTCASPGACSWDSDDVGKWVQIGVLNSRDRVSDVGQYQIVAQDADKLTVTPAYAGESGSGRWYFIKAVNTYTFQALVNAMPNIALDWQYRGGFSDHRQAIVDTLDFILDKDYWPERRGLYTINDAAGCAADIASNTANGANNCQFSLSATDSGKRFLSLEVARAMALGVKYGRQVDDANTASRVTAVDDLMSAALGGLGGPGADSTWATEYNDNEATFTAVSNGKQKNFGFCCGVGGATTWDAERLGGLAAEDLVSFKVPLNIASVVGATKASVTLYEPRGFSRSVRDQTGSSASVTGDARQGDHLAKIEYVDSTGSVLDTVYVMVGPAEGETASESAAEINGAATVTGSLTVQ